MLGGLCGTWSVGQALAQQVRTERLAGGGVIHRVDQPEGSIGVPLSWLVTPEQAAGARLEEVIVWPGQPTTEARSLAAARGIEAASGFLEILDAGVVRGRRMREIRIHGWVQSGATLRSLRLHVPAESDEGRGVGASGGSQTLGRAMTEPGMTGLEPREQDGARRTLSESASPLALDSPLAAGDWHRLEIPATGLYELTSAWLQEAGIGLAGTPSDRIRLWGRPGTPLPERNDAPRTAFEEIAILVEDKGDGRFDEGDRIVFYAEGPAVTRDAARGLEHRLHPYAASTFVYLGVGDGDAAPRRIGSAGSVPAAVQPVERVRQLRWVEQDQTKSEEKIRSGRDWLGQVFTMGAAQRAQSVFSFSHPGLTAGAAADVTVRFVGRATSSASMAFSLNGEPLGANAVSPILSYTSEEGRSGSIGTFIREWSVPAGAASIELTGTFTGGDSGAEAFIDWARIEFDATLHADGDSLSFHAPSTPGGAGDLAFAVTGFTGQPLVLDVTDPLRPKNLSVSRLSGDGAQARWRVDSPSNPSDPSARRAYHARAALATPASAQAVPNQNLKGNATNPDYVIVTDESLLEQALEWAEYRAEASGLRTLVATQQQILNEFSAGAADPTAIRDFVKHLYDRALADGQAPLEHLLLFGESSYDTKGIRANPARRNLVLTYQSLESLSRINSYGSDDYFALLDDGEGEWSSTNSLERIDIGVGRWPVQTAAEARVIMDKTRRYEQAGSLGGWRTRFTFLADDDFPEVELNRDLHTLNADGTAEIVDLAQQGVKIDKIYMLSYPVENTGGGRRVPQATEAMVRAFNEGSLVMNYSGHGNQFVLADERLFTPDILPGLTNAGRPSIFVTATCQFGRYDDTDAQSGAEQILLLEQGGAVASLTTTRVVFTASTPGSNNYGLNIQLTRAMLERDGEGRPLSMGEIYRRTKNTFEGSGFNARKFILLGDPAMRFGLPEQRIAVESVNGADLTADPDTVLTVRALDEVRIGGSLRDGLGGVLQDVDGELELRVYDARRSVSLPERPWVQQERCYLDGCAYMVENDLLYSGRATVSGGRFESVFRVPRDVRFSAGNARVLAYAVGRQTGGADGEALDASGAASRIAFNGINTEVRNDGTGPELDVYLNDEDFVNGNLVGSTPTLFVTLDDQTGINTSATGVGHEIIATIDTRPEQVIVLNDYFESNLDDYRGGRIEYPLPELSEGNYTLKVRAWDVFNNPSENAIRFEVADSRELEVRNVANYPNPMNSFTRFFFEHNQPGTPLDVDIRIYTLSGKPVQRLRETLLTTNSHAYLEWNGRDRDHDRLANGTYLYVLRVGADTGQGRQSFQRTEKLVVIR